MSATFTNEELRQLPAWARDKIASLEKANVEALTDIGNLSRALDFEGEPAPGSVEIDPFSRDRRGGPRCLPPGTAVEFHNHGGSRFRVRMTEEFQLEVRSTHGVIVVRPNSANLILVEEGRF